MQIKVWDGLDIITNESLSHDNEVNWIIKIEKKWASMTSEVKTDKQTDRQTACEMYIFRIFATILVLATSAIDEMTQEDSVFHFYLPIVVGQLIP